jgi:hypothetical protein
VSANPIAIGANPVGGTLSGTTTVAAVAGTATFANLSIDKAGAGYTLAATSRKLLDLYQKSVIPGAQLALESSMAGYQTGTLDFLSLFSNFMNVVEYELMYHEEVMQFQIALARLEEMTGMPL